MSLFPAFVNTFEITFQHSNPINRENDFLKLSLKKHTHNEAGFPVAPEVLVHSLKRHTRRKTNC